jgi:hypothetical protein
VTRRGPSAVAAGRGDMGRMRERRRWRVGPRYSTSAVYTDSNISNEFESILNLFKLASAPKKIFPTSKILK